MSAARDLVHNAVSQGISDPTAIATWTALPIDRVHTELGRLADLKLVRKDGKKWFPGGAPELSKVWK